MLIELKGIVQYYNEGHKYVEVIVIEDSSVKVERKRMGVDMVINRGKVINFLAELYGIPPGDIVWPDHILLN